MAKGNSNSSASGAPAPTPSGPIGDALGLVSQIVAVLKVVLMLPLTSQGRKKLVKVRRKAEKVIPQLLKLAIAHPSYAPVGQDPNALLAEWQTVTDLEELLSAINAIRSQIEDTVLQKGSEVWKSVLVIYDAASAQAGRDPAVTDVIAQMQTALSHGPRVQKSVRTPIPPTPVKGKKAKSAALAAARRAAGAAAPAPASGPVTSGPATPAGTPGTSGQ